MTHYRPLEILCMVCMVISGFSFGPGSAWSQDTSHSTVEKSRSEITTITMESYAFTPHTLIAEIGKPIHFLLKNESFLVPHNFLLDSPDGVRLVEANVDSGDEVTIQFTPTQSGVYSFYCDKQLLFFPNHREEGMEGSITVH